MTVLYNARKTAKGYIFAKFDEDFNVEAIYEVSTSETNGLNCSCPASGRPTCKHRKMVLIFRTADAFDTDRFYCYETQSWHTPLAPQGVEPMADKLDSFYATVDEVVADEVGPEPVAVPGANPDIIIIDEAVNLTKEQFEAASAPTPSTFRRRF